VDSDGRGGIGQKMQSGFDFMDRTLGMAIAMIGFALLGPACGESSGPINACYAAGGQCVGGGYVLSCVKLGPNACGPSTTPEGSVVCCLEFSDAGDAGEAKDEE
jgi:hypothetical protein